MPLNDPVPSNSADVLLRNAQDFDKLINDSGYHTNRIGNSLPSYIQAISELGFNAPVAFTAGINADSSRVTVTYTGNRYFANPDTVPFITTSTFNPAQWHLLEDSYIQSQLPKIESYAALRLFSGNSTLVYVAGRTNDQDGAAGMFAVDEADTTSADNGGTILVDAIGRRWKRQYSGAVSAAWFGVLGSNADNSTQFENLRLFAAANAPVTINLAKAVYSTSTWGNWAIRGLTVIGQGILATRIKRTGTQAIAFNFDAFSSGSPSDPFIENCQFQDLTFEGNSTNTTATLRAQGISRSSWRVNVTEGNSSTGVGVLLQGFMLSPTSTFTCSTDIQPMTSKPNTMVRIEAGTRAAISVGNSSNNVFLGMRGVGSAIGIQLTGSDQNTFIGGSAESNTNYGALISTGCRYNTFIGTGFENPAATSADVQDTGESNKFINIYTRKKFVFDSTAKDCVLDGGFHERVETVSGARNCEVKNVKVKFYTSLGQGFGAGGFFDNAASTQWSSVYDANAGQYVYPFKPRSSISLGASPATFTNSTDNWVEVIVQSGTLTQVRQVRSGDAWLCQITLPQKYLLAPNDSIEFSYSVLPVASYVKCNTLK